ncbi:MAG: arginine--tRNA ligase [Holosporaceae bacterium]|jgi:arginyl-tRNA synthetase|nr:arginine--tRNA ligase [Holosporaceae bacterium]
MGSFLFSYYCNIIRKQIPDEYQDLVSVDPPKNDSFGDFSTNVAMLLAKRLGHSPMDVAYKIRDSLEGNESFSDLSVKNPGFINWKIPRYLLQEQLRIIIAENFGKMNLGRGKRINVEYVSANPTGPLHAGHARGAIAGDVLANLLSFVGYDVTREYYINDAGKQVEILARSLFHRYLELLEKTTDPLPDWAYPGDYLIAIAGKIVSKHEDEFATKSEVEWLDFFKKFAVEDIMEGIRHDMHDLGIYHNVFSSELNLMRNGAIEKALELLRSKNLIYVGVLSVPKGKEPEDWEEREQLLFRSTAFGDDVDRPLQKSDGSWTYFATDIAYHLDKINRGFDEMIDFWGSDHGGYVKRMQAAVTAVSDGTKKLEVRISQVVRFMQDGREVKMSKRAGTFITLRDIIDRVGRDVIRFIMLTRLDGALLDFDFKKVIEQNRDNPVFYVQYAYARTWSAFRQFHQTFGNEIPNFNEVNVHLLDEESELQLIKVLVDWPRQILMAAKNKEPHRIAFYLCDVAAKFHYLWNNGKDNAQLRFILVDNFEKTCARMMLLRATQLVIESAFGIIGVTPVKELR